MLAEDRSAVPVAPDTELTAVVTKAVVAICVVFVPAVAVGAVGVPVKAGLARGARRSVIVVVANVPVVGNVTLVVPVAVKVWANAPA